MSEKEKVKLLDLGKMDFKKAWEFQEQLLKENVQIKLNAPRHANPLTLETKNYLLFCEHPHVYTLGKSGSMNNLLIDEPILKKEGIQFFHINRGGDITYHGPGQIVVYPILDLEKFNTDITWYLRTLEEVVINVLNEYHLEGNRIKDATGVWIDASSSNPRKICAMGVRCSRWISMHGFALNINTDLSFFDHIVPCGISDKGVTSLGFELNRKIRMEKVKSKIILAFEELFQCDWHLASNP